MKKIYCLIGKSSSGKDTIAKEFLKISNLQKLMACTTRPKRTGEEDGKEYKFIQKNEVDQFMCAKATFNKVDGSYDYGFVKEKLDEEKDYFAVASLYQIVQLHKEYPTFDFIVIFINNDEEERIIHAIKREEQQKNPDYKEICRRIIADSHDFSLNNPDYISVMVFAKEVIHVENDYNMTPTEIAEELVTKLGLKNKN